MIEVHFLSANQFLVGWTNDGFEVVGASWMDLSQLGIGRIPRVETGDCIEDVMLPFASLWGSNRNTFGSSSSCSDSHFFQNKEVFTQVGVQSYGGNAGFHISWGMPPMLALQVWILRITRQQQHPCHLMTRLILGSMQLRVHWGITTGSTMLWIDAYEWFSQLEQFCWKFQWSLLPEIYSKQAPTPAEDVWPWLSGAVPASPREEVIVGETSSNTPNGDGKTFVGGVICGRWAGREWLVFLAEVHHFAQRG